MPALAEWLSPFVKPGGHVIALKGPSLPDELAAAFRALKETRLSLERVETIAPPGRDWDHRVAVLKKTGPLPAKYPRKSGEANRNPL